MKRSNIAQERDSTLSAGADRPDQPAARSGDARFSLRQSAARNFPADSFAERRRRAHAPDDARGRFPGSYLPEFGQLTCLVQHEFFHRYTADEHTLVCIEKLDALLETDEPKLEPYQELFESWKILSSSTSRSFFTTRAKASARGRTPRRAHFSRRRSRRVCSFIQSNASTLVLLVDHHVTLSNMAQQRNLDDPETVIEFANIVKTRHNLDRLMLLTLADGQGTTREPGRIGRSRCLAALPRDLGLPPRPGRVPRARPRSSAHRLRAAVAERLAPDFADEIDAHFEYMPDNYFRTFDVEEIADHLELFRELLARHLLAKPNRPSSRWCVGIRSRIVDTRWSRSARGIDRIYWSASRALSRSRPSTF